MAWERERGTIWYASRPTGLTCVSTIATGDSGVPVSQDLIWRRVGWTELFTGARVQLTDPRFLEYVGAPESSRLMSRNPEYWVHHMGVENALSAALQLQHDAGLVLSNIQVLQQLVTSMGRTASDVLLAVHGRQAFPSSALQQVIPSYRVRRASHYMSAMGLWRPPVETVSRTAMSFGRLQRLHIVPGLLSESASVEREVNWHSWLRDWLWTIIKYIPCDCNDILCMPCI